MTNNGRIDPITLEVVRHKLDGIANEMEMTLLKSSFSPIVKEGLDASASLFTPDGTTLAQACAIPVHLATLIPAIAEVRKTYPLDTMQEGDVYVLNDPYCGGTHLPDFAVILPVFHRGRIVALSATMTHHQDVGGATPGSIPTNATEIFQEGIRVPPLKLREAGRMNDTLVKMLRQNVRIPDMFMGDLHAQIAAGTVGARRIGELADRHGSNEMTAIFGELLDRSEQLTREAIKRLPQGTFHYVDYLDNDGIELDKRIRIEVTLTIEDGNILFDFTGSSPQVQGPLNCVPSGVQAAAFYAIRALTDSSIPTNGGCFRPVRLKLPEGSVINPNDPAPVNARGSTIKRVASCCIGALAQALPDRIPAGSASQLLVMAFGGKRPDGSRFVVGDLVAGGSGGAKGQDGVDVIETDATNCMNLPAEALEMDSPIRMNCVSVRRDSGGAGEYRGGLGVVREYEALCDGIKFSHRGERHFVPAQGLQGGKSGAPAYSVIKRASGKEDVIPSKIVTTLNRGDRLIVETAGGGGYGDPRKRKHEDVEADIRNGKISETAAREQYGLVRD